MKVSIVLVGLLVGASAWAAEDPYFSVSSVKVQEVETPADLSSALALPPTDLGVTGDVPVPSLDASWFEQIVNIGEKVWEIVSKNKPVSSYRTDGGATVVPKGISHWMEMQGWQTPKSRSFRVSAENAYGMNVIDFTATVIYTHGGNIGGRGKYLSNVQVIPSNISVAWGYTFNANAGVAAITNAGTAQQPVAAVQLLLHWSMDTVLSHHEGTEFYYVRGDGEFSQIN